MTKKLNGGSLKVYANGGHAVLNDAGEGMFKLCLLEVMLILADADGFRINLDKLCQRILHPAGNGNCTAFKNRVVRQLLCRIFGS